MSGELWLGEGFTSYAESLLMARAGIDAFELSLARWAGLINAVTTSPAVSLRSAAEMSELAPFTDAASAVDRTNWDNTFVSYYTYGAALGLGLDLTLRGLAPVPASFDAFMRAMWNSFGKPGTAGPAGIVARPYTPGDLRDTLADVARDGRVADEFLERHVRGRQSFDWARLFAPAGVLVRRAYPGQPTLGDVAFDFSQRTAKVSAPTPFGSPAYVAGLAQDDVLQRVDGQPDIVGRVVADGARRPSSRRHRDLRFRPAQWGDRLLVRHARREPGHRARCRGAGGASAERPTASVSRGLAREPGACGRRNVSTVTGRTRSRYAGSPTDGHQEGRRGRRHASRGGRCSAGRWDRPRGFAGTRGRSVAWRRW